MDCGSNVGVELTNQHGVQKHRKKIIINVRSKASWRNRKATHFCDHFAPWCRPAFQRL